MDLTHTLFDGRRERQRKGKKWFRIRQEDRLYKCKVQGASDKGGKEERRGIKSSSGFVLNISTIAGHCQSQQI
jgi:hypothetical protein